MQLKTDAEATEQYNRLHAQQVEHQKERAHRVWEERISWQELTAEQRSRGGISEGSWYLNGC